MKKVLLSLAALSALAMAVPAAAQPYGNAYGHQQNRGYDNRNWTPVEVRLERLQERIQRGVQSGRITRREAQGLRMQFRDLVQRERVYSRNGLSWQERADLDARLDRLQAQIRWERRDDDRRYDDRRHDDRRYDDRRDRRDRWDG